MKKILFTMLALVLMVGLALPMALPAAANGGPTKDYGDVTLSDWGSGNFPEIWDLTKCDLTLSYTLDMSAMASPGWTPIEVGLREVGHPNLDPNGYGGWLESIYKSAASGDTANLNDYHVLMIHGWLQEYYDREGAFPGSSMSPIACCPWPYDIHAFWFDRDGVDATQATFWNYTDGKTYNTGGVYDVEIQYHANSATEGVMYVTINGEQQGFYTQGYESANPPEMMPVGRTFAGDMTRMQVFYGRGGGGGTVDIEDITVDGCLAIMLCAGQNTPVGTVGVWNDGDTLYVKYVTDGDWMLAETHLDVACDPEDIPQTKKGNPIPGHFAQGGSYDPLVSEATFTFGLPLCSSCSLDVYIAAHAVVVDTGTVESMPVISDMDETVTQRRAGNVGFATVSSPTVAAWEPGPLYPNDGPDDSAWEANSLWDQNLTPGSLKTALQVSNADWIWESYRVQDPVYGTVITVEDSFDIPGSGYPAGGSLLITCDNGYETFMNGSPVGSGQTTGAWQTSDLKEASLQTSGWQSIEQYDVSAYLQSGGNKLTVDAGNEYFDTDDGHSTAGTQSSNPGGLIYALEVDYYPVEETAWGDGCDGERFVDKGNWATYFTYAVQPILVDTVSVPAAGGVVSSSIHLEISEQYLLKAAGTAYAGDTIDFDAKYSITGKIPDDTWTDNVSGYEGYGTDLLELKVDGVFVNWGDYDPGHVYDWCMSGTGSPVALEIYDIYYPNNTGSLTVEIYLLP